MYEKLEPFEDFQPTKPLSYAIEKYLRQYAITDFICNAFLDTLLLKAGLNENVIPEGLQFIAPDFLRVGMLLEGTDDAIEKFHAFLTPYGSSILAEKIKENHYSLSMDCAECLDNVFPVFVEEFKQSVLPDANRILLYQQESSKIYDQYLEEKARKESSQVSVAEAKESFFSTTAPQTDSSEVLSLQLG